MEKVKYYQIAFKGIGVNQQVLKLTSPSSTELEALRANGWTVRGYKLATSIPANPFLDGTTVRKMTVDEIQAKKLSKMTRFLKRKIRQACQAIDKADPTANIEAKLNIILQIPEFALAWNEAINIDLNDLQTIRALNGAGIDVNAIKKEIGK